MGKIKQLVKHNPPDGSMSDTWSGVIIGSMISMMGYQGAGWVGFGCAIAGLTVACITLGLWQRWARKVVK